MNTKVDPNKVEELSAEFKRLSRMLEDSEMSIHKEISSLISETNAQYNENYVRATTSEMASLLKEIRVLAASITDRLTDQSSVLQQAAGRYRSDEEAAKKLMQTSTSFWKSIHRTNKEFLDKDTWIQATRDGVITGTSSWLNTHEILKYVTTTNGLKFKIFSENGKTFIRIVNEQISSHGDYLNYKRLLRESLGGPNRLWKKEFVKQLIGKAIPVFDQNAGTFIGTNGTRFLNSNFAALNNYLGEFNNQPTGIVKNMWKSGTHAFVQELKVWNNFNWKDTSKITKFGKAFGVVGTALTVLDNWSDNFYNQETGELEYTYENKKEFVVDTTVDVAAGAAAVAAGAAFGSVVPIAGTAAGAVIGGVIYFGMNVELIGAPPKSVVDFTKEAANNAVDYVEDKLDSAADYVGDQIGNVTKRVSSLFW